jgi:hypothetical protein
VPARVRPLRERAGDDDSGVPARTCRYNAMMRLAPLVAASAAAMAIVVLAFASGRFEPSTPAPAPRIAVRVVHGVPELYDRQTEKRFLPRGSNYVRLAEQVAADGTRLSYHSTFDVGRYMPARVEAALRRMDAGGYNTVRVFVNGVCRARCAGDASGGTISAAYAANLADFLRRAKAHRVLVVLTADAPPSVGRYAELLDTVPRARAEWPNIAYLTEPGVEADSAFWRDLVAELLRQHAPIDAVLAYELRNEAAFRADRRPLTLRAGRIRTSRGRTYDLGRPGERRRMLEQSLVSWIDRVRAAVKEIAPEALVAVGFPLPQRGDPRIVPVRAALERSSADIIDVHAYPRPGRTLREQVRRFGLGASRRKLLIMGEFGAFKADYRSPEVAARRLRFWLRSSCRYDFDGWLVWTWDTAEQPELWNALSGLRTIERTLAPKFAGAVCARP